MADNINPDHYKRLPAEAIEIIESAIDNAPSNQDAYLHGQVLKYILRCWNKNGIEDLKKAKWYLDRLVDSLDEYEEQKASDLQSLKDHPFGKLRQPKWTPKIGDWVRIKKPADTQASATSWWPSMDKYDGQIIQVKQIEEDGVVFEEWGFMFDWLEPAEQPKATLNSDTIPEGYRKLNDSSEEPRQLGDLRWSVAAKRYVEISVDEIGYANRDNWAACRKIEPVVKQSLTTEPPDGWRWLEVGEVICKGDLRFKDGLLYTLEPIMIGRVCQEHWMPIVRKNRFEVGEKVVYIPDQSVWTYVSEINDGPNHPKSAHVASGSTSLRACVTRLAPYIEETK